MPVFYKIHGRRKDLSPLYPTLAWLVAADFSDLTPSSQKIGSGTFNFPIAQIFTANIKTCRLLDLGFNGTPFTWSGKCNGGVLE
ncbi:hypothetical protein LguiA_017440 [Lonicera macranthoides]